MPEDEFETWLRGFLQNPPEPAFSAPAKPDLLLAKLTKRRKALIAHQELLSKYRSLPDGGRDDEEKEDAMQEYSTDPIPARPLSPQEERDAIFEDRMTGILVRHEARMRQIREEGRYFALITFLAIFAGLAFLAIGALLEQKVAFAWMYCLGAVIALMMVLVVTRRPVK